MDDEKEDYDNEDEDDEDEDDEDNDDYRNFNQSYFTRVFEHEKMLSDKRRMDFYHRVIKKNVQALVSSKRTGKSGEAPEVVVLDVGTGTGVLAAWASKSGASRVIAIDHSEECVKMAATLADANQCKNIEFMVGHSSQFECDGGEQKVDMIIHEQIGDILFDEYMVRTLYDLKHRVLKKGGLIVPSQFSLFIEPVQLDEDRHVSMMSNIQSHGLNFACLQQLVKSPDETPDYYHYRSSDPSIVSNILTKPTSRWEINLNENMKEDLTSSNKKLRWECKIVHEGRMDALCVYFGCRDGNDSITNGPSNDRCTHWGFRLLRVPEMFCKKGDCFMVSVSIVRDSSWEDLNGWRWSVVRKGEEEEEEEEEEEDALLKQTNRSEEVRYSSASKKRTVGAAFMSAEDLKKLRDETTTKKRRR